MWLMSLGLCGWITPDTAHAMSCGFDPRSFVLPPPNVEAPLNVRPIIRLGHDDGLADCVRGICADQVEEVSLWRAPGRVQRRARVETTVTEAESGATKTYYLEVAGALERETRYELRAKRNGVRRPVLLGSFRTGTKTDTRPPEPPRSITSIYCPMDDGTVVLERYGSFARLFGDHAVDPEGAPPMYAVWVSRGSAGIEWSKPPLGIFRPERLNADPSLFELGASSACSVPSFDFPSGETVRIGLRAIDFAFNLSAPVEVTLTRSSARNGRCF